MEFSLSATMLPDLDTIALYSKFGTHAKLTNGIVNVSKEGILSSISDPMLLQFARIAFMYALSRNDKKPDFRVRITSYNQMSTRPNQLRGYSSMILVHRLCVSEVSCRCWKSVRGLSCDAVRKD